MRASALLVVLSVACQDRPTSVAAPTVPASSPRSAGSVSDSASPAAEALRVLGGQLARVRAAGGDKPFKEEVGVDVGALRGVSRDRIRAALGEPHTCREDVSTDSNGARHPVAPCETHDDWFYSFYRLPAGWAGGGPELLLQFDAAGACSRAVVRHTQ